MNTERWQQLTESDREHQTAQALITAAYFAGKNPMLREAFNILSMRLDDYEREIARLRKLADGVQS